LTHEHRRGTAHRGIYSIFHRVGAPRIYEYHGES